MAKKMPFPPKGKPSVADQMEKAFEKSKYDKDKKGVKEGSPEDMKADKKQMPAFIQSKKENPGPQPFKPFKKGKK